METPLATLDLFLLVSLGLIYPFAVNGPATSTLLCSGAGASCPLCEGHLLLPLLPPNTQPALVSN